METGIVQLRLCTLDAVSEHRSETRESELILRINELMERNRDSDMTEQSSSQTLEEVDKREESAWTSTSTPPADVEGRIKVRARIQYMKYEEGLENRTNSIGLQTCSLPGKTRFSPLRQGNKYRKAQTLRRTRHEDGGL